MDDLRKVGEQDQLEAAIEDQSAITAELASLLGQVVRSGGPTPPWWPKPDEWASGCPHLGSPIPVFATFHKPSVLYCHPCSMPAYIAQSMSSGCDLCGRPVSEYRPAIVQVGPLSIGGDLCVDCVRVTSG